MRILFFISIALWVGISQAQSVTHKSDTLWYNETSVRLPSKEAATGYWTFQFKDRKVLEQHVRLLPSRQLLTEATFDWKTRTGYAKSWFKNGQLHTEQELYYPNNDSFNICIRYISCFDSNGHVLLQQGKGEFVDWHPNGQKSISFSVENGMIVDSVKVWNSSGILSPYNSMLTRFFTESDILHHILDADPAPLNLMEIKQKVGYPTSARDAGIQGLVVVLVLVDAQGNVEQCMLWKSAHEVLDNAVLDQIRALRFTPAVFQGKSIPFWVNVPFEFTLLDRIRQPKQKKQKK